MSGLKPISFEFIAAGVARRARMSLCKLTPSQVNKEMPSWNGHEGTPETTKLSVPITDRSYWEGRYILTELTMEKDNGKKLVINDAAVSISREKHIVRTTIVGLEGSVKEYINSGDYDISITVGIVAVRDGQIIDEYPEDGIREVRGFLEENKAISVASIFFSIFDINHIVISRFSLHQDTHSNRQVIEIKALSDVDYKIHSSEY